MKVFSGGAVMWRGIGLPRVYVGVCAGSRSVGRPQKRWIDTVKVFIEKRFQQASKENGAG